MQLESINNYQLKILLYMKKSYRFLSLILFLCLNQGLVKGESIHPIERSTGKLHISIDPRIELLAAIHSLSNNKDLANRDLPYGKEIISYFEFFSSQIENQTIYADKEYTNKDTKFISCLPNPYNSEKGMSIYTALSNKNIQDINDVFHGGEDYIVFLNRDTILSKGFYKKNEKWVF